MDSRAIVGSIPLEEIPSMMRAIGYYPSEEEITNMVNEIRYKSFMVTGQLENTVQMVRVYRNSAAQSAYTYNLPPFPWSLSPIFQAEFIKLYLNHRPVLPLNNSQITQAFETICAHDGSGGTEIKWSTLKQLLIAEGESIASADLDAFLAALVGGSNATPENSSLFDPRRFADEILGFEL